MPDLTNSNETTQLPSLEELLFQRWAAKNQINDLDHPDSHYDYRGFWRANPDFSRAPGQHLTDQFKQHGHPTFSVESKYSTGPNDGGHWSGDTYLPQLGTSRTPSMSPDQLQNSLIELLRNR